MSQTQTEALPEFGYVDRIQRMGDKKKEFSISFPVVGNRNFGEHALVLCFQRDGRTPGLVHRLHYIDVNKALSGGITP